MPMRHHFLTVFAPALSASLMTAALPVPANAAATSGKLDVYRLAASCAWIQRNSGARNPILAARHVDVLKAAGVPWRRCINRRYPLRTICWWLAEANRLNPHVRKECTGSL